MWPSRALTSLASLLAVAVIASACSDQKPVAPESDPQLMADASTPLDDAGNPIKVTFVDSGGSHLQVNPDPPPDGTINSSAFEWIASGSTPSEDQYALRLQDDGGVHLNFHFQTTSDLTIDFNWQYHAGSQLAYMFNDLNSTSVGFRAFTNGIAGTGLYFRNEFGGRDIDLSHMNVQDGDVYHIRVVLDADRQTYTVYIDGDQVAEEFYDGSGFTSHDPFRVMGRRTGSSTEIQYDHYLWIDQAIHRFETPIRSDILHYALENGEGEVVRNGALGSKPSDAGPKENPCETFFGRALNLRKCDLLRQLRDPAYYDISHNQIDNAQLFQFVEQNTKEVQLLIDHVDFGRDVDVFLDPNTGGLCLEEASDLIKSLDKADGIIGLLEQMAFALDAFNEPVAFTVANETIAIFGRILDGIRIYRRFECGVIFKEQRQIFTEYFDLRLDGKSPTEAWDLIEGFWGSNLLQSLSAAYNLPLDKLGEWHENAFVGYRLVALPNSRDIRIAEGRAIAEAALDMQ